MKLLDLTLETPEENLALDEALLESAEASCAQNHDDDMEALRLWEPRQCFVVAGSSSRLADEVRLDRCAQHGVPVLRRPSGGAAIVAGPGCLMYSLVLGYRKRPKLRSIDHAHGFVLDTIAEALNRIVPGIHRAGISDLACGVHKFSGNSLRCKREHLLYHGTLLHHFRLEQIAQFLKQPPREPEYREHRSHRDFVVNLPIEAAALRLAVISAFNANQPFVDWPKTRTLQLTEEKYRRGEWNWRS